jgi:hypothetical protein
VAAVVLVGRVGVELLDRRRNFVAWQPSQVVLGGIF